MTKFRHPDHELDEAERLICVKIRILHVEIIHLKCKVEDSGRFYSRRLQIRLTVQSPASSDTVL